MDTPAKMEARHTARTAPSLLDVLKLVDQMIDNGTAIQKGGGLHKAIKLAIKHGRT